MRAKPEHLLGWLFAVAVVAGGVWFLLRPSGAKGAALEVREKAMEMLGARIAAAKPGAKVLVLSNPFSQQTGYLNDKSQYERVGISGLRKGLGRGCQVEVAFPEILPEYLSNPQSVALPPDTRTPLSFLIRPGSVDRIAAAHADCRVIVSLIGLPAGVDKLEVWGDTDTRSFALLLPDLRVVGTPDDAVAAFERGKLLAAVGLENAGHDALIVTRDNVAQVLQQQPKALGY